MTATGRRRTVVGFVASLVVVALLIELSWWAAHRRGEVRLPALDGLVVMPVTSRTDLRALTVSLSRSGRVTSSAVGPRAGWSGLDLGRSSDVVVSNGFIISNGDTSEEVGVRLSGTPDSVLVAIDKKTAAVLEKGPLLAEFARTIRSSWEARMRTRRRGWDCSVLVEADAAVPFEVVALITAFAAERGLFCGFATPAASAASKRPELGPLLKGAFASGCTAVRIRSDGRAPWGEVAALLNAAADAGISRYTFSVSIDEVEKDLASDARPAPARIFFPDVIEDDPLVGPK